MIAIGIGCRKGCEAQEIVDLVQRACARAGVSLASVSLAGARLCSLADKQCEAGVLQAAIVLGLPLVFFPASVLAQMQPVTRSTRVMALFGTPSVAEAAALAGAGPNAILTGARLASKWATCAIARPKESQ